MSERIDMHALADGQLQGEAKARAEAARASSAELSSEYEAVLAVKSALSKVEPVTCAKTWEMCRSRLDELGKRERVEGFVGRYAWGLCSIFFVVILSAAIFNRMGGNELRTGDVAKVLSGFTSGSRSTSNQAVPMTNWIRSDQNAITLQGSEPAIVNGFLGTVYRLTDRHGPLAYVTIRGATRVAGVEPMLEDRTYSVGKINDTNCVTWNTTTDAHLLIADRPYEDLAAVADRLRE